MYFQSLASLWFALSLPLIVLLYLLKRTYIDTNISSSLLWRRLLREQEANRPWQKLKRQLLLLLQLLAAALLVLALLGPYIYGVSESSSPAAVVLDTSASMTASAAGSSESALELAKQELKAWLRAQPSSKSVTLIVTGEEPMVLAANDTDTTTMEQMIDEIKPNYGRADLPAALTLADAVLRQESEGEIRLFTDGQQPVLDNQSVPTTKPLHIVTVNGLTDNIAIAAFGISGNEANKGLSAVVTLINHSSKQQIGTLKVMETGKKEVLHSIAYSLKALEQRSFPLSHLPEAASYQATIGNGDAYPADNTAFAFPTVSVERKVLLVSEGNLFLNKALQLSGIRTVQADPIQFVPDDATLENYDWVVLDAVDEGNLQSEEWRSLLANKPVWRILSADHLPEGAEKVLPEGSRVKLKEHPVIQYLSFEDTYISRLVKGDTGDLGDPIVTYGGIPAIYAGTVNGKPELLFTFDLQDSDLPLRPEFPILISQAAEWMSGGLSPHLGQAAAGSRIDIQIHAAAMSAEWLPVDVLDKGNKDESAVLTDEGIISGEQMAPSVPGLYRFVEKDQEGSELSSRLLSVVVDPEEGIQQVNKVNDINYEESIISTDAGTGSGTASSELESPPVRSSIVPWIAVLLLLLITAEWGVYRRGTSI